VASFDDPVSRRRPGACPIVVAGASGRHLGSALSVERAHDWAHGQVRVGSGPLWVVDLSGLPAGSLTVRRVNGTGCWETSVSVLTPVVVERCGPRRGAYRRRSAATGRQLVSNARPELSTFRKIGDLLGSTFGGASRSASVRDVGLFTAVECDPESLRPVRVVGAYLDRSIALERARARGSGPVVVIPLLFDPRPSDIIGDGSGDA
jgi:hypothetical protein